MRVSRASDFVAVVIPVAIAGALALFSSGAWYLKVGGFVAATVVVPIAVGPRVVVRGAWSPNAHELRATSSDYLPAEADLDRNRAVVLLATNATDFASVYVATSSEGTVRLTPVDGDVGSHTDPMQFGQWAELRDAVALGTFRFVTQSELTDALVADEGMTSVASSGRR